MKKNILKVLSKFIIIISLSFMANMAMADTPPDPPGGGPGGGDLPVGGSAPIDGGLSILLAAGLVYGTKKYFSNKK